MNYEHSFVVVLSITKKYKCLAMLKEIVHAPPQELSLKTRFLGVYNGGALYKGAHFYEHVLVQTRQNKLNNNNNNNNNHHGS